MDVCHLCKSAFCLVRSPEVCITLHRRRDETKGMDKPMHDTAVKAAAVKK